MANSSVDIEYIVEEWAKDFFRRKANKKEQRLLEKDKIRQEVDWKKVRFVHEPPKFEPEPPKPGGGKLSHNVLFHTTFTNKTDAPQTYNFKADRVTKSCCTLEIEEGYTKGYSMEIKVATPEGIMEANAGFSREITLNRIEGQSIEEELAWGVNSEISVKEKHRAVAKLIITEEEYHGKFVVKTSVKGRVRVVFTNIKDNNSFIRAIEGEIYEIVRWAMNEKILDGKTMFVEGDTRSVICMTRGQAGFKYGLKQDVEVDQMPIDSA